MKFSFKPDGAVLRSFMRSDAFFRGLRGHVGSGKSVACAVEIFRRACQQEPHPVTKIRQTRWAVIRNTNPQLKTTTIATWLEWFPEEVFGKFNWSPPYTHHIRVADIDMEVIFLALDTPADIRKLLSLELTGGWLNEAREIEKPIVDATTSRVRRFPSRKNDGPGPTWSGVIADTNPPAEDHWWGIMAGDVPVPEGLSQADLLTLERPANWEFFTQPAAMLERWGKGVDASLEGYDMNPLRENAKYLPDRYYQDMIQGKTKEWINVYVLNKYGAIFDGRPVYPDFDRKLHVAPRELEPIPGFPIYVGIDPGLTPGAVFAQRIRGKWFVLRELVATNMGMTRFAPKIRECMGEFFAGYEFVVTHDPYGDNRVGTDENTPARILAANGITSKAASTNDPELRIAAVSGTMVRLVEGSPGYIVSPACPKLIAAKEGGYHYKPGKDRPEKNFYSNVSDAEQYMMDGAGETRAIVRHHNQNRKVFVAKHKWNPMGAPKVTAGLGRVR